MKKNFLYLIGFVLLISFASCEKDEKVPTDFIGTWTTTEVQSGMTMKSKMILTANSVDEMIQVQTTTGAYVDFVGLKGSLSVSGNKLTMTMTEVGMADIDYQQMTIGQFVWYSESDDQFTSIVEYMGGKTSVAEYKVEGNTLTIKGDGETSTYTKM